MGVRLLVGFLLSCWNQSITLRQNSHLNVGYIDDSYLQGKDVKECLLNISATQTLFTSLGFVINVEKSSLILSQQIKFLGLVLDLVAMSIILTEDKRDKLKALWKALQHKYETTITDLGQLVGTAVSSLPVVQFERLHDKKLEIEMDHKGN